MFILEVNLDIEDGALISQLSAGRQHLAVLTTNGNGDLKNILTYK